MKIYSVSKAPKTTTEPSKFGFFNKTQANKPAFASHRKFIRRNSRKPASLFNLGLKLVQFSLAVVLFAALITSLQSVTTTANIYQAKENRAPNLIIDFEQKDKNSVIKVVPVENSLDPVAQTNAD